MNTTLARNIAANMLQTLISTALLFALYRYINVSLGVEKLGIWAVVLATVSAARIADLGLSSSVTRFVAINLAKNDVPRAIQTIDTTVISLLVLVGSLAPIIYLLTKLALPRILHNAALLDALAVLPYALTSLWLTLLAAVLQGGLDGCQRMGLRSVAVIISQAALLASSVLLVPTYGLTGLAIAQTGQALISMMLSRIFLCRSIRGMPWIPTKWNKSIFLEQLRYSTNVQAASISMLLFDATTKILLAKFAGPSAAGLFEMANQLVQKSRALIVTANQAAIPHITTLAENEPERVHHFYRANIRVLFFFSVPTFTLLLAWGAGFSWLLIGSYQAQFVTLLYITGIAWLVNILATPAYFANLGTGHVGRNTIAHVIIGLANITLGWTLGSKYGAHGVAYAYATALILGSVALFATYGQKSTNNAPTTKTTSNTYDQAGLVISCSAVIAFTWITPINPTYGSIMLFIASIAVPLITLGTAMWFNPIRRELWQLLASKNT